MNKGLEAQGTANLQDSGLLTLAYRKEPKMTDETDTREGRRQKKNTGGCNTIARGNEIRVGK
jgi:hypothetical protein